MEKEYHLPSPDSLVNKSGFEVSKKNGDISIGSHNGLVFSYSKQARAVKAFSLLSRLMGEMNSKAKVKDGVLYTFNIIDGELFYLHTPKYEVKKLDIYFFKEEDARKVLGDPNWSRILVIYLRGEYTNLNI